MEKKCKCDISFKDYCLKMEPLVADKLLGILHVVAQVFVILGVLISGIKTISLGGRSILWGILSILICIPLASIFTRFWFELLGVLFSIDKKLGANKK